MESSRFETILHRPVREEGDEAWCFVVLPEDASAPLPRRGRTTVEGTINGHAFRATLEPDGRLSHWLKVPEELCKTAGAEPGGMVALEIGPVEPEPEPEVPADLQAALAAVADARATWAATTTLARVDWIHWITTGKQAKTRMKRIADACSMLAQGKKRVCCFDPSGFYSKALRAPEVAE